MSAAKRQDKPSATRSHGLVTLNGRVRTFGAFFASQAFFRVTSVLVTRLLSDHRSQLDSFGVILAASTVSAIVGFGVTETSWQADLRVFCSVLPGVLLSLASFASATSVLSVASSIPLAILLCVSSGLIYHCVAQLHIASTLLDARGRLHPSRAGDIFAVYRLLLSHRLQVFALALILFGVVLEAPTSKPGQLFSRSSGPEQPRTTAFIPFTFNFSNVGVPMAFTEVLQTTQDQRFVVEDVKKVGLCRWRVAFGAIVVAKSTCGGERRYLQLPNAKHLFSKDLVWKSLRRAFGRDVAKKIVPESWEVNVPEEWAAFKEFASVSPNASVLIKTEQHRQKGLTIVTAQQAVDLAPNEPQVLLVQRVVDNILRVDGRAISCRFYASVGLRDADIVETRLFTEGKVHYSATQKGEGGELEQLVATAYTSHNNDKKDKGKDKDDDKDTELEDIKRHGWQRWASVLNDTYPVDRPPYLQKFLSRLDRQGRDTKELLPTVGSKFGAVVRAVAEALSVVPVHARDGGVFTELFGVDFVLTETLDPFIVEVNRQPDLDFRQAQDRRVKLVLVRGHLCHAKVLDGADCLVPCKEGLCPVLSEKTFPSLQKATATRHWV